MPSYAGVTFTEVMPDPRSRPDWERRAFITERVIPYANKEDVQSAGRGNYRITVPVTLTNVGDLATLQSAQGATRRTLTNLFGSTYSNVLLVNVGPPERWENEARAIVSLTFVREGG